MIVFFGLRCRYETAYAVYAINPKVSSPFFAGGGSPLESTGSVVIVHHGGTSCQQNKVERIDVFY